MKRCVKSSHFPPLKMGAKRSEKQRIIKKSSLILVRIFCIAPLKKISAENPYDIRGFGIF